MTPSDDSIPTPYGDVWFEIGIGGERILMYSDRLAEAAAVEAYLRGDYGSLLSEEITFIREAEREANAYQASQTSQTSQTFQTP